MIELPAPRANILIVDDTPANLDLLGGVLEDDHELSATTSGSQALALLAEGYRPDLILLDVMMPEMDGYQVCAALKRDAGTRDIPVIFITAKTDAESETRALSAGAVDFIHKPLNPAVVRARVHLHLELEHRTAVLKQSLADLKQAQTRLRVMEMAIEQSPTSIVITGPDGTIEYVNPHFMEESGFSSAEAIGQNPRILKSGLTDPSTFEAMWKQLVRGEPWVGELVNRRKSGEVYWEEAHIAPVRNGHGNILHYVAVKLDITERKKINERLAYMAHHDVLTDLPNRVLFFERVGQGLALARRNKTRLALMFIDLDKFKPINDIYGHATGDQVLKEAAKRMSGCVRSSDTVGRIGGDEFVVLLTDISSEERAVMVANKIRDALNQPFTVAGHMLSISASIGVAIYPEHGADETELARNADDAMYLAKESTRDSVMVYWPGMVTKGTR